MNKFLLALDIDGTLTDASHTIPDEVVSYLKKTHLEGGVIAFITGRFFPFALAHLDNLPFPYYLATQNGAQLFEMPKKRLVAHYYLDKQVALAIDDLGEKYSEDFILYTDQAYDYKTFYRQSRFSQELLNHILKLGSMAFHPFVKLDSFADLPCLQFPCLKNFGTYEQLKPLHDQIVELGVEQSLIQDPTSPIYCMNLVTHKQASKGGAILSILNLLGKKVPVIGAGNDRNDLTLLAGSDVGICVGDGAPLELKQVATWHAPTSGRGLLPYLDRAKTVLGL